MKNLNCYLFILLLTIIAFGAFTCSYNQYPLEDGGSRLEGFPFVWLTNGASSLEYIIDIKALLIDFVIYYMCIGFCVKTFLQKNGEFKINPVISYATAGMAALSFIVFCLLLLYSDSHSLEKYIPAPYTREFHFGIFFFKVI